MPFKQQLKNAALKIRLSARQGLFYSFRKTGTWKCPKCRQGIVNKKSLRVKILQQFSVAYMKHLQHLETSGPLPGDDDLNDCEKIYSILCAVTPESL